MGSELMYNPLALKKAKTVRDAFLQGFFLLLFTCENYLQLHQERCSILS